MKVCPVSGKGIGRRYAEPFPFLAAGSCLEGQSNDLCGCRCASPESRLKYHAPRHMPKRLGSLRENANFLQVGLASLSCAVTGDLVPPPAMRALPANRKGSSNLLLKRVSLSRQCGNAGGCFIPSSGTPSNVFLRIQHVCGSILTEPRP